MQPPHRPHFEAPENAPIDPQQIQQGAQAPPQAPPAPAQGQDHHPAPQGYYPPPQPQGYYPAPQGYYPPQPHGYPHPQQTWLPPVLTDPGLWHPDRPEIGRAEMGVRFVARFIDSFFVGFLWYVMMLLGTVVSVIIGGGEMDGGPGEVAFMVTAVFNFFLLSIVLEWLQVRLWGRSLGKIIMGLWVVRSDGSGRVKAGRAFVRALLYAPGPNLVTAIVPWFLLNVLWPLRDKRYRRCLHDKIAGTVVVQVRR